MIYDKPIELIFKNIRDNTLRNDHLPYRYRVKGNIFDTNRSDIKYITSQIIKVKLVRKAKMRMKVYSYLNNYNTVKLMIKSPMIGKQLAKKRKMDIDYITNVKVKSDENLLYNVNLTPCISKNPFFRFSYKDIKANSLTLEYTDNNVTSETIGIETIKVKHIDKINQIPKPLKLSKNPKNYPNKIEGIKKLFGNITLIEDGIQLNVPKIASTQRMIPIHLRSNIQFKSIALFVKNYYFSYGYCEITTQYKLIAQWFSTPYSVADFYIKIKMDGSGEIVVVIEAKNGKFYTIKKEIEVPLS